MQLPEEFHLRYTFYVVTQEKYLLALYTLYTSIQPSTHLILKLLDLKYVLSVQTTRVTSVCNCNQTILSHA